MIGVSVIRKESQSKVSGQAKYTADFISNDELSVKLVTSTFAHAKILKINFEGALKLKKVRAVLTANDCDFLTGPLIKDRPPLAKYKVRYYGEPVAMVIADDDYTAAKAVSMIAVEYEQLPVISSPRFAISPDSPILHENLKDYKVNAKDVYPKHYTNICDHIKIRKGDADKAFTNCDIVLESRFTLPQCDHIAMEPRAAKAQIDPDGNVYIMSSSQSPFEIRSMLSEIFKIDESKITVNVPLVGGAFGGKSSVQLEILAYIASKAMEGKKVSLTNSRENDIATSPCKMGLEATIKMGALKNGRILAAKMTFLVDSGAYSDIGPRLAKAAAADCSGPYNIENLFCDSFCVYTNHNYATAFRGFAHASYTFCIERMIDKLANKLKTDPANIRLINALVPNCTSPTLVKITPGNLGDLKACIEKAKQLIDWDDGILIENKDKIISKGIACLWKTSNSPTDAQSGVFLIFNKDGSVNLNCGCTEFGPGMKTTAAQILAEKLQMDINKINVNMDVNTKYSPEHWKTVASMTTYMVGNAVLQAADDAVRQIKENAASVLKCRPREVEFFNGRVFLKKKPNIFLTLQDVVHGYKYQNGNAAGGMVLGRGRFVMNNLSYLDTLSGAGKTGPAWTIGAQAIEVEFDKTDFTYRFIKVATVLDVGRILNPKSAHGQIKGAINMGLGMASREYFKYDDNCSLLNTSLRTYKVLHFGEAPQFLTHFIQTPQPDAPYGAKAIAEQGIIAIPAALGNALSRAAGVDLDELPLLSETIWRIKNGGSV